MGRRDGKLSLFPQSSVIASVNTKSGSQLALEGAIRVVVIAAAAAATAAKNGRQRRPARQPANFRPRRRRRWDGGGEARFRLRVALGDTGRAYSVHRPSPPPQAASFHRKDDETLPKHVDDEKTTIRGKKSDMNCVGKRKEERKARSRDANFWN
ncbi:hypothetical protein V9T40_008277 [Parthenolecanium corni]|uniref:Uncharacterized protein n=1 Tax=Parthenolecanium corni TaxID=536013 RepID=A0AAN9TMT7_9HEMI